ncbi:MAG: hypothetical protein AAF790_09065 [Planctomycetota bacterium]
MLKDALEFLTSISRRSNAVQVIGELNQPASKHVRVGDELRQVWLEPAPRDHTVLTVYDLAEWTNDEAAASADGTPAGTVTWVDLNQIVCVLDDGVYRLSRVTMPLTLHPLYLIVENLQAMAPQPHLLFVAWLRANLAAQVGPDFIANVSSINCRSNSGIESSSEQGRDSFGKSVSAELIGADALPETVSVKVPVWLEYEHTITVPLTVQVDPHECTFRLQPTPGEVERRTHEAVRKLRDDLAELCQGRVLAGRP